MSQPSRGRAQHLPRVAILVDCPIRPLGSEFRVWSTCSPFLDFACASVLPWGSPIVVGRAADGYQEASFPLPQGAGALALPGYPSLHQPGPVVRAIGSSFRPLWRLVKEVDLIWAFGPHPLAVVLEVMSGLRRRPLVLGVRSDPVEYFRTRAAGGANRHAAQAVERMFRELTRGRPITIVGERTAPEYRRVARTTLSHLVSVVRDDDIASRPVSSAEAGERLELLAVGRLAAEKAPEVLLEALAKIAKERPGGVRLRWAGEGPLAATIENRAKTLGLGDCFELTGFVAPGPTLRALYRDAHVFVHTAFTEGVPQVLFESLAAGLPVVATGVGGVRDVLTDGEDALVVGPGEADAVARAVLRIADNRGLAQSLASTGLKRARHYTLEVESARVGEFLAAALSAGGTSLQRGASGTRS